MIAVIFWIGLIVSLLGMVGVWFMKWPFGAKLGACLFFFVLAFFFFFQDQSAL